MRSPAATVVCICVVVITAGFSGCTRNDTPDSPAATNESPATAPPTRRVVGPLSPEDAQALATMNDRIRTYVDLHIELERGLPKLPDGATPQQIDQNQREFEKRLRKARATAKQGDIFTAEAEPVIRRLLATVFGGPEGRQLKSSIMDENPIDPAAMKLSVNDRYPDSVPLSTIPPEVLQTLPELPEDLEYRFVGDWLILLDPHAHVVADYIENAIP